ncbi:hypothetical protein LJR231_001590 [Phyllobacterium sp. LjRoot231]|uniref:hypothetical protein n=1 Tax=Phyllobacterium sp. LjRoot231 TaxID=3342289 RepID=UPI003ECC1D50
MFQVTTRQTNVVIRSGNVGRISDALTSNCVWNYDVPPIDISGNFVADKSLANEFCVLLNMCDAQSRLDYLEGRCFRPSMCPTDHQSIDLVLPVLMRWWQDIFYAAYDITPYPR